MDSNPSDHGRRSSDLPTPNRVERLRTELDHESPLSELEPGTPRGGRPPSPKRRGHRRRRAIDRRDSEERRYMSDLDQPSESDSSRTPSPPWYPPPTSPLTPAPTDEPSSPPDQGSSGSDGSGSTLPTSGGDLPAPASEETEEKRKSAWQGGEIDSTRKRRHSSFADEETVAAAGSRRSSAGNTGKYHAKYWRRFAVDVKRGETSYGRIASRFIGTRSDEEGVGTKWCTRNVEWEKEKTQLRFPVRRVGNDFALDFSAGLRLGLRLPG